MMAFLSNKTMMKNILKKLLLFLVGFGSGFLFFDIIGNQSAKNEYICNEYTGQIEAVEYALPNYDLIIGKSEDDYFIEISLNFADNNIKFAGDEAYLSFNLNGLIPYSLLEAGDTIAIPLDDGFFPAKFSTVIKKGDYLFDKESEAILIDYLNGKQDDKVYVFSICIYAPDGKILHVANKIL